MFKKISPELKLMLACLRMQQGNDLRELSDAIVGLSPDWDTFTRLTIHHRVYPLVYRYLTTVGQAVAPCGVITFLRHRSRENLSKSLQLTGEMVKLLRVLEQEKLRAVVLKGLPLGYRLYGNVALRPAKDLDLLIWPEDVEKARRVMEVRGYEQTCPEFTDTPERLQQWMQSRHHFEYLQQEKKIQVELHWRLGHYGTFIPLTDIKSNLTQVKLAGQPVFMLGPEELLLYLILHGAEHAWFRLRWLCDVAALLERGCLSWERLYSLAEHWGLVKLLNQAVMLADNLLNAPVPEHIAAAVRQDPQTRALAAMVLPIIETPGFNPADLYVGRPLYYHYKKYMFSIQCGTQQWLTYLRGSFAPTDRDIALVPLPASLGGLYYLMRPVTWLGRQVWHWTGK